MYVELEFVRRHNEDVLDFQGTAKCISCALASAGTYQRAGMTNQNWNWTARGTRIVSRAGASKKETSNWGEHELFSRAGAGVHDELELQRNANCILRRNWYQLELERNTKCISSWTWCVSVELEGTRIGGERVFISSWRARMKNSNRNCKLHLVVRRHDEKFELEGNANWRGTRECELYLELELVRWRDELELEGTRIGGKCELYLELELVRWRDELELEGTRIGGKCELEGTRMGGKRGGWCASMKNSC